MAFRSRPVRAERLTALPVPFSWTQESHLHITSHASGASTNRSLKCHGPRSQPLHRSRFQLGGVRLSSPERTKPRTVWPKIRLLRRKNRELVILSTLTV